MSRSLIGAKAHLLTWVALLVLTTATLLTSFVLDGASELVAALVFAIVKASLVAWFFMHLVEERLPSRLAFAVGFIFTALLVGLTVSDVLGRPRLEVQAPQVDGRPAP